jgi:uncharacterized protein (DUF1778 family)
MRRLSKSPKTLWNVRLERRDRELLFLAASREEISQSDFLRRALRERAERVLRSESATA